MVKNLKRTLAFMLAVIMICSSTFTAFAEEGASIAASEATTTVQAEEIATTEEVPAKEEKKEAVTEAAEEEKTIEASTQEEKKAEAPESSTQPEMATITAQPADVTVYDGEDAVFALETSGAVKSCQWQMSKNGGRTWSDLSRRLYGSSETLTIKATRKLDGRFFRCVVTFKNRKKEISEAAALIVNEIPTYPKASFSSDEIEGMTVEVDAPEGALPKGTTMEVAEVNLDAVQDVVDTTKGVEGKVVAAVDITFVDINGNVIEPNSEISVKMTSKEIAKAVEPSILHVDAKADEIADTDAEAEKVEEIIKKNDTITFSSDQFSVYVVIDQSEDETARAEVNFYNGDELIKTYYVKNGDTLDDLDEIVADPGVGTLNDGELFQGWYTSNTYTTSTKAMDIGQVRTYLNDNIIGNITEGDKVNFYAVIFKYFTVTYYGYDYDTVNQKYVALGTDTVLLLTTENSASYTVNQAFTPKSGYNFEGWEAGTSGTYTKISGGAADKVYGNLDNITITGDVVFNVVSKAGNWLMFNKNGDGATYVAPQFVYTGANTKDPEVTMTRLGYTFGGWYTVKYGDNDPPDESKRYTFGSPITEDTTIYAKWIPKTTAPYTVIFWTQNLDGDDYDLAVSVVENNGTVGDTIPYGVVDNRDEDYVTGYGAPTTVPTDPQEGYYRPDTPQYIGRFQGFCLTEASKNQQVEITPEGDAVLNLYYDRITYNFKFYLYRDGTTNDRYDYANNSGDGRTLNDLVTWHSNQTEHPSVNGYTIQSETVNNRTYHYFTITAKYGQDISGMWPTYDKITGANRRNAVSYVMMVGTALKPNPTHDGDGTVKGIISVMNENILGATNDVNGNYVVIRFPDSYYEWRYHIWFETIEGVDYSDKETHEYKGKTYYEETVMAVRSSNTTVTNQNAPKYEGYEWKEFVGQNWNNANYWTTSSGGTTYYHIRDVYNSLMDKITYFDGSYFDGNGNLLKSRGEHILHSSDEIQDGATIADEYKNYKPTLPEGQDGFVFEGWYADEGCNGEPYTFTTMPVGGITVYAKWRQIQYRVFLHPNAEDETTNPGLNWGDEEQQMNFRISSGDTVNTPWGLWTGGTKEFVGWYTDEACTNFFNDKMELNETSLKNLYTDYDKSELTDNMDIYGNIDPDSPTAPGESGKGYNSDKWAYNKTTGEFTERDRWWITHKLDLYALWRTVLVGADGINVTYNAVGYDDTNPATEVTGKINEATTYTDPIMYLDQVEATATAASTPDNDTDYQFLHWVVQKWNGTEYVDTTTIVYPGDGFTVLASYAKITDKETGSVVTTPDPDGSYIYNLQLRAVYGPTETATPTFVDWYQNEESATTPIHQDKDKQINQLISTYDLTTNTSITIQRGHVFLGWSIQEAYENDGNGNYLDKDGNVTTDPKEFVPITYYPNLTEDDLDLKYDRDSGKYLGQNEKKEWVQAKGVAADEVSPYDAIYAVWQDVFYIVHGSDKTVQIVDMSSKSPDKDKAREAFTTGASVGNDGKVTYTNYYYGGYGLMADTTAADPAGFTLTKGGTEATYTGNYQWTRANSQKSATAFDRTVGDVYYLKEVSSDYLASPKVAAINADKGKGALTSLSGLSVVDTTIYRAGGINDTKGTFAQTFTLYQLNEDKTVEKTPTDADMFGLEGFFTVNALSTDAGTYVLTPYWVTYDNIKVTSNSSRSITIASDGKVTDSNTQ